jgi:nitroimidazol reductase NimA-like FMN-containing flavoprotein (pyridoxamine 5'-phosphate oxidase superfamily)
VIEYTLCCQKPHHIIQTQKFLSLKSSAISNLEMKERNDNNITTHKQTKLTESEVKFVTNNEVCRIATTYNNIPHVVPISYIYENGFFYFATDYNTKKYRNLKENNRIALVIDVYNSSVDNKAVMIQGITELIESGKEFRRLYKIFEKKFEWVRNDPWKENEAPFVKIKPSKKVSWGLEEIS